MIKYLSGNNWQIKGFDQFVPIKETSMETGIELTGITDWIQSEVPGGVHSDLFRNGIIENPIVDTNSYNVEWIERRWWMYKNVFDFQERKSNYDLIFEGIDYEAYFYLNGIFLGEHIGMYTKVVFDISKIVKETENILVVVFKNVPDEMGQIGYTSKTSTQKSRFNYKWDFSARIVNIGIWKDVYIKEREEVIFENISISTDYNNKDMGIINTSFDLVNTKGNNQEYEIIYTLKNQEGDILKIHQEKVKVSDNREVANKIEILKPNLWYVNGDSKNLRGVSYLYSINIEVKNRDEIVNKIEKKVGIRSISYKKNETNFKDALPYTFVVNGEKIYIKGVNITPLDTMYGSVKNEQYEHLVRLAVNANVNLIRVWGGGLIEKEIFYDLCDKHGILVWQDFIQSSSGIDNQPCHDEDFLKLLKENSIEAIKEKRNHTSLACWCGGNELMDLDGVPITYEDKNIKMLKELVEKYNPNIMFYPSTASGPTEFKSETKENHDIHGGWEYKGNPYHYEYYGNSNSLFHSEFGTEGLTSLKSIKKFVSKKYRYPSEMNQNKVYKSHGAWWGTHRRDTKMFYNLETMTQFIDCGQYLHAEGLRFILEANRRRKFENSGSIIWQINEPFPNVSCTSLVDYYGECKPVYYFAKRSYANKHISLKYDKLDYSINEVIKGEIFVHNSDNAFDAKVKVSIQDVMGEKLFVKEFEMEAVKNKSSYIGDLDYTVEKDGLFVCTLELYFDGLLIDTNRYIFSTNQEQPLNDFGKLEGDVKIVSKDLVKVSENCQEYCIKIKNYGKTLSPLSGVEVNEDCYYLLCDDNYFDLLPEEEKIINAKIYCKNLGSFLFDESFKSEEIMPTFNVRFFGQNQGE